MSPRELQEEAEKNAAMKQLQEMRLTDAKNAAALQEISAENARLEAHSAKLQKVSSFLPKRRKMSFWSHPVEYPVELSLCTGSGHGWLQVLEQADRKLMDMSSALKALVDGLGTNVSLRQGHNIFTLQQSASFCGACRRK